MIRFEINEFPFAITNDQLVRIYTLIAENGWHLDYDIVEGDTDGIVWLWIHFAEGGADRAWIGVDGHVTLQEEVTWEWKNEGVGTPTPHQPEPAEPSPVSYDPCVRGSVEIGGRRSEFMLPLNRPDVSYSQWGADNAVLGERTDLLESMAGAAREWAEEHLCRTCGENPIDDGEGYDGECGDCADKTDKEDDNGND